MTQHNQFDQPIGFPVPEWKGARLPERKTLLGKTCKLEPLSAEQHAEPLYRAYAEHADDRSWTYLPYGPFRSLASYCSWIAQEANGTDPYFYAIIDLDDPQPVGIASYLRIDPKSGSIEVGHIHYADRMKRSLMATEAMYLMMRYAFEMGYRRYEWKCDALNQPSRNAALRLGFRLEGVFRQALVYKQRNRDTAWFAVIDSDWPVLKQSFESWLAAENFDDQAVQRRGLAEIREELLRQASSR